MELGPARRQRDASYACAPRVTPVSTVMEVRIESLDIPEASWWVGKRNQGLRSSVWSLVGSSRSNGRDIGVQDIATTGPGSREDSHTLQQELQSLGQWDEFPLRPRE